jgi:hypothetical protein
MGTRANMPGQSILMMSQEDLLAVMEDNYYQRFAGVEVTSEVVCQILQISIATLDRWVKVKVLNPVNEANDGSRVVRKFDLSYILRQDRAELKSRYRYDKAK